MEAKLEVQRGPNLSRVLWQFKMEPDLVPFPSDTEFCAGSAVSSRTNHFPPASETRGLRGSEPGGWWGGGQQRGVWWVSGKALCKKDSSFPHSHAGAPVPAHSVPRAIRGKHLSLKAYFQTQLSTLGLLSLDALHLPPPWVVLGWGWVGGRLVFDRQLGSQGCRPGPLPAHPPIPAGSRREAGGGGNFTGKLLFLPRTDTGWGPSFPLAATETGAT